MIIITFNIILFSNIAPLEAGNAVLQRAYSSSVRFLNYWPVLWVSWFALYLILTLLIYGSLNEHSIYIRALINLCNNFSGVVMFSLYYEMAEKTEADVDLQPSRKIWIPATMLLFAVWGAELIFSKHIPTYTDKISADKISAVFSLASGLFIGTATGLLVTKLASRILNLSVWVVTLLVFYAILQPVFPIIAQSREGFENNLTPLIAMLAFYGKVFLLIVVHWARDTNNLIYYMVRARRLHDEEDDSNIRQLFMLVLTSKKNLHRWQESGQPQKWVEEHKGIWNDEDWFSLLNQLERSDFWPMDPDAVGATLEKVKRKQSKLKGDHV